MKEFILLFFFIFCFSFVIWIFYYFILFDKRIERRMNYYFDIDKSSKNLRKRKISIKQNTSHFKTLNELIRKKIPNINQEKVDQILKSAGIPLTPEEYLMLKCFSFAILGGIFYFLTANLYLFIPGGIIGYIFPGLWVKRKRKVRIQKFNEGLPDMITTIIGSLRSGYSFSQALKTVAHECDSPIKEEITFLLKQMNYGITIEDALNNLNIRMPSNDLELMIQATLIQKQVGGNLASVLDIIVKTIRERNRIHRQVQSLTSQGRLSGKIVASLPIVLGLIIYLMNPEYIKVLFNNTIGIIIITTGITSGIIGFILINKLTKIEV